jgi:hypothetical protein
MAVDQMTSQPVNQSTSDCGASVRSSPVPSRARTGAVLLEVIFSVALMAAACGAIIGGFHACTQTNHELWLESRAADLAVTLLSEIQMSGGAVMDEGPTDYPAPFDDWTWQVATTDLDPQSDPAMTMMQIRITITHKAGDCSYTLYWLAPADVQTSVMGGASLASGAASTGGGP